jgi:enoyl-CoA hydratase/carnithine racemase
MDHLRRALKRRLSDRPPLDHYGAYIGAKEGRKAMAKVECKVEGAVRHVLLNRADKRNALDAEMVEQLRKLFSARPGAAERVAVIRAAGPVFCAGLDLREQARAAEGAPAIERMLGAIEAFPLPVVAVVQGDAIAGGNELALHCDFVVASTVACFGMSLARIGMSTSWFLTRKLMEVAGPVATRRILLLGEPLPAAEMHRLGIISHLAQPVALEDAAQAVIDRLEANAPLSLRTMKALIVRQMAFREHIAHADIDAMVETVRMSMDAQEGIAARLAKREPQFLGR